MIQEFSTFIRIGVHMSEFSLSNPILTPVVDLFWFILPISAKTFSSEVVWSQMDYFLHFFNSKDTLIVLEAMYYILQRVIYRIFIQNVFTTTTFVWQNVYYVNKILYHSSTAWGKCLESIFRFHTC